MSGDAGRPVSFLDEFTDMFRRASTSSKDIFGEDTLYGMYGIAHSKKSSSLMKTMKLKGNLFVPKNLGNKETNSSILTDQSTKYLVVEIIVQT